MSTEYSDYNHRSRPMGQGRHRGQIDPLSIHRDKRNIHQEDCRFQNLWVRNRGKFNAEIITNERQGETIAAVTVKREKEMRICNKSYKDLHI